MSPASTITAAYLILGLVPLLAGGFDLPRIGLALAHLVACAILLYLGRRDRGERISIGSWLPLLIIPILYAELAVLNQWGGLWRLPLRRGHRGRSRSGRCRVRHRSGDSNR